MSCSHALLRTSAPDAPALDALLPAVYAELRRQAARALRREAAGHTLGATALVHEAYLRLAAQGDGAWPDRAHFVGIAAHLMRQILVDHARARHAAKRGDGACCDALGRLAALDPAQARLVELRYFGGLTIEETAAALGVSPATVKHEWAVARAWLRRELHGR